MRKDIRLQFDCEIASQKEDKDCKKHKKRIIYLSDHICSSVKERVAENNVLFLPAYKKTPEEKMTSFVNTFYID